MIARVRKWVVEVREVTFDDDLVRGHGRYLQRGICAPRIPVSGITEKNFDTVKSQFSRFLFGKDIIGAYYQGELIVLPWWQCRALRHI